MLRFPLHVSLTFWPACLESVLAHDKHPCGQSVVAVLGLNPLGEVLLYSFQVIENEL